MDKESDKKEIIRCPACDGAITKGVTKCKHCRHRLSRNPLKDTDFVSFVLSFAVVMIIIRGTVYFTFPSFEYTEPKKFSRNDKQIEVVEHRLQKEKDNLKILGNIKNNGPDTWSGISIEVHLYNKEDQLVDIIKSYVSGNISPGETRPFKATNKCGDEEAISFHEYKVFIKDAFHEQVQTDG